MKLLWIDLVSEMGGAQHSMLDVCKGLLASGLDISAAVPYGPLFDGLSAAGIPVFPVSPVRATRRGWGLFLTTAKLLKAPSTISQIVRTVKPDIIHANSLPAFLAASHTHTSTPLVWHVRDLRLPAPVAREASKKAARIIAASDAIDEYLVEILSPRILGRIRVIRNGIDPTLFVPGDKPAARERLGLGPDTPVVGMIAHLVPWKRHDAFIESAVLMHQQRPDLHFVVVGRDLFHEHTRWVSQLESKVREAGLDACFHWVRESDSAHKLLPAFDLLMHPALHEPFGRVICEAMATAIPVVAAESGGPMSIIEPGVTGFLVRDGDPAEMAQAGLALLADPGRAARFGAAGRARVEANFTTRHVCDQLSREYKALLASVSTAASHDDD